MRFSLVLGPYEAKVVVVGPLPSGVAAPEPSLVSGNTLADLGGDWTLDLNGKQLTTPLKSWEDLGTTSFAGPATYRKQFTVSAAPAGKRVFLEIADVHDYARVKAERERVGGPRLAAVPLGGDQRGEAGRERSGSGSAHDGGWPRALADRLRPGSGGWCGWCGWCGGGAAGGQGASGGRARQALRQAALAAAGGAAMRRHRFRGCWGRFAWWRDEEGRQTEASVPPWCHLGPHGIVFLWGRRFRLPTLFRRNLI